MKKLIPLFGKWYTKKELKYKTWCTSKLSEYNLDTSAGYPKPIEINTKEFANTKEFTQAFNDYLIYGKCILHVLDNDIVRYSSEKKRVKDKEP